jgi:predicted Rossmann-fold nucleotide-binding protein
LAEKQIGVVNGAGSIGLMRAVSDAVMDAGGKKISFDDWMENYNVLGSIVKISIKQKDGAVYPEAIKVLEDGEERDPFADM